MGLLDQKKDKKLNVNQMMVLDSYLELLLAGEKKLTNKIAKKHGQTHSTVSTLINSPEAQKILKVKVGELLAQSDLDKLKVMTELSNIAFSNIKDLKNISRPEGMSNHF